MRQERARVDVNGVAPWGLDDGHAFGSDVIAEKAVEAMRYFK
jgi:hypothetical protein